jgi:hypothetical protein
MKSEDGFAKPFTTPIPPWWATDWATRRGRTRTVRCPGHPFAGGGFPFREGIPPPTRTRESGMGATSGSGETQSP